MLKAVLVQAVMILVVATLVAIAAGAHAAWSAALGGLACVIPNALFALRLSIAARRPGGATVHELFIGEFVKVAATVLLLVAVAHFYRDLNWLAFIIGCIATLKSYFLMFFLGPRLA
jgi:ATP synthase protein I